MDSQISQKISTFIVTAILEQPDRTIDLSEPLISSGLIDSFHLVDLALYIEDEFGVHIDDTELTADTFDSIQELTSLVQSRMDQ